MIKEELKTFFDATGLRQIALSRASGVPCSTISNLLSGKRKHVIGPNQDALRDAMRRLEAEIDAAAKAGSPDA